MSTYLWIAFGGALGSMARYGCSEVIGDWFGQTFPWGTLVINIAGSLAIGVAAALTAPEGRVFVPSDIRQFVMIGLCGGFTTFSAFSLQTLSLAQSGEYLRAGANVVGSVIFCLLAVWLGFAAGVGLGSMRANG